MVWWGQYGSCFPIPTKHTLVVIVGAKTAFVMVATMTKLRVSCLDSLDVLSGFFTSSERLRPIGVSVRFGGTSHDVGRLKSKDGKRPRECSARDERST